MKKTLTILSTLFLLNSGYADDKPNNEFQLKSYAFKNEQMIPRKFTCEGKGYMPSLKWKNPPAGTKTFAIIVDDPDVAVEGAKPGTFKVWDHWVIFNIPGELNKISKKHMPNDAVQGKNSWGESKYGGPCPPDREHRYFFKLYALDTSLDLTEDATAADLHKAMAGHVLGETVLMGKYNPQSKK